MYKKRSVEVISGNSGDDRWMTVHCRGITCWTIYQILKTRFASHLGKEVESKKIIQNKKGTRGVVRRGEINSCAKKFIRYYHFIIFVSKNDHLPRTNGLFRSSDNYAIDKKKKILKSKLAREHEMYSTLDRYWRVLIVPWLAPS